jgi:hypothetical protein
MILATPKHFFNAVKSMNLQDRAKWLSLFCAGIFCLISSSAFGQKQTEFQKLIWARYALGLELSKRFSLETEVEERRFVDPWAQHQLLFRSVLQYKLPQNWQVGAGFTYFLQSPQDPLSTSDLVVPELRPHQELNYRLKFDDRWKMRQRFKLEERFVHNVSEGELTDGYLFNFRFRFKTDLIYSLLKNNDKEDRLLLIASDEFMFNAGKQIVYNVFDQNRVYGGMRWVPSETFGLEAGYLWWYQQRANGKSFYSRDILRITIYHNISLVKKES